MSKESEFVTFPSLPPLPNGEYRTVVADPPWNYNDNLPSGKRGAESHYDTLHHRTVAGMGPQVRQATRTQAHCYIWATNSYLREAFEVMESWGFTYKTMLTWVKVLEEPDSLPHERDEPIETRREFGMGHYYRNATEHLLFGTKGNLSTNRNDAIGYFFAETTDHSAKPEKAYRLIEELSDGPYLDIFAREPRDGWDVWGDEVDGSPGRPKEPEGDEQ